MKPKRTAFALLGRVTWKVMAVFGSRWAKDKLNGSGRSDGRRA